MPELPLELACILMTIGAMLFLSKIAITHKEAWWHEIHLRASCAITHLMLGGYGYAHILALIGDGRIALFEFFPLALFLAGLVYCLSVTIQEVRTLYVLAIT